MTGRLAIGLRFGAVMAAVAGTLLILASPAFASTGAEQPDGLVFRLAIFVLSIFVGYYVVWSVTPALHTPLMAVTNAISSVIIVGALIAAAAGGGQDMTADLWLSKGMGGVAVALAAVNIFGGFLVTRRMLAMYKKKDKPTARSAGS
jgi:NAD(P) transhydrogenase subunit alpha